MLNPHCLLCLVVLWGLHQIAKTGLSIVLASDYQGLMLFIIDKVV